MADLRTLDRERRTIRSSIPVGTTALGERSPPKDRRRGGARALVLAGGTYLVLSLALWSGVWLHHPSSTTTCGCGDASLFTWFLAWPAYAIAHAANPLYSGAMFHPTGVNMVANTGVLAVGVVLAPVTWLFGPTATLNVASTLAPALSATAMFVLIRRWVRWSPAAFVGGLFYGFSPFILVSLTVAHLMLAMAVVPPLIVLCLDELLLRHEHPAAWVGVALGLLVTVQFFLGTEVLLITAFIGMVGVVGLIAGGGRRRDRLRRHARRAAPGLVAAAVTAGGLLAYPLWFALAGPAHLSDPIWPTGLSHQGGTVGAFALPTPSPAGWSVWTRVVGQFQGPLLSDQYIGIGALVVVVVGWVIWRRDRRLWFFGSLAVVSLTLDLGVRKGAFLPWQAVAGLPLLQDVVPSRFMLPALLSVAVMLAVVVDHTYSAVNDRAAARTGPGGPPGSRSVITRPTGWRGGVVAVVVAAIALGPVAWYLRSIAPVATRPVVVPRWFQTVAPRLPGSQVLLVLPAPSVREAALTWQAIDRMHYRMATGSGPADDLSRAGALARGESVLYNASTAQYPQVLRPGDTGAVRRALVGWGVTMVVIPDQADIPIYDQVTSVPFAVALITAATGRPPVHQASAWVWYGLARDHATIVPVTSRLVNCTDAGIAGRVSTTQLVSCVLDGTDVHSPVTGS